MNNSHRKAFIKRTTSLVSEHTISKAPNNIRRKVPDSSQSLRNRNGREYSEASARLFRAVIRAMGRTNDEIDSLWKNYLVGPSTKDLLRRQKHADLPGGTIHHGDRKRDETSSDIQGT